MDETMQKLVAARARLDEAFDAWFDLDDDSTDAERVAAEDAKVVATWRYIQAADATLPPAALPLVRAMRGGATGPAGPPGMVGATGRDGPPGKCACERPPWTDALGCGKKPPWGAPPREEPRMADQVQKAPDADPDAATQLEGRVDALVAESDGSPHRIALALATSLVRVLNLRGVPPEPILALIKSWTQPPAAG